jgi:hypothetical protein
LYFILFHIAVLVHNFSHAGIFFLISGATALFPGPDWDVTYAPCGDVFSSKYK